LLYLNTKHTLIVDNNFMPQIRISLLTKILPLFGLLLVISLLSSHASLDPGLLIRFLGLQVILALLLVQWLVNKQFKLRGVKSPLWIAWLLFAMYTGVRLLWGNSYSDSLFEWMKILSYQMLLFLLIQNYSFKELRNGISYSLSILGMVLAIWGLVELVEVMQSGRLNIPLSTYQVKTVFGHRNLYLQILFLTLPFQLYLAVIEKSKTFTVLIVTFSSLSLFLLIVLSNRSVWLSLVMMTLLFTGFVLWNRLQKSTFLKDLNKPFRWIGITFSVTLLLSILFFAFFTVTEEAESHAGNILKMDNGSGKDRIELWKRTLQIIEENPVFGCGAANWKIEMLKYGNKGLVSENNVTYYQRPHNDFLWIAGEYGLFGGIIYILGFLMAFYLALSQIKNQQETRRQLFFLSVLFALTGFTLFSFFSFPHERIVSNIILFTLFALLIAGNAETEIETTGSKNRMLKWMSFLFLALLAVGSFYFGYQRYNSESHTKGALEAKMDNQPKRVIEEINQAESAYYQLDPLSTPLLWYAGLAWYQLGKPDSAIRCFTKAMALNPYHVHVINNLASSYVQIGENEQAISLYKKALKIYPEFEESALNLCAVYFNEHQNDSALSALSYLNIQTSNPNFKPYIKAILKAKIISILTKQGKTELIHSLPDDPEWYFLQYKMHTMEGISIENLIFDFSKQQKPY